MNKTDAIRTIIETSTDEPIVFTTGYTCRIARGVADRPNHFYMTGSMGLASSIGIGIAQQTGRPTIVVDGDGSLLMNPVGLLTAGAMDTLPLVHVVLDDGRYASTGGQHVPASRADLGALARACGYRNVREAGHVDALAALMRREVASCSRPSLIHCVLSGQDPPVSARVDADLGEHAARFGEYVRELAGR
ncbi:thiamine pyrophosphate-dependent enzyme [Streptosporangium sp. NPDC051022]|uniref:thiamine pyrophosphate-dependent enzyme n=1 Tax=Streptosporangium sp. NPDC051022 TaxID=3155752 RepID=UPI003435DFC6